MTSELMNRSLAVNTAARLGLTVLAWQTGKARRYRVATAGVTDFHKAPQNATDLRTIRDVLLYLEGYAASQSNLANRRS